MTGWLHGTPIRELAATGAAGCQAMRIAVYHLAASQERRFTATVIASTFSTGLASNHTTRNPGAFFRRTNDQGPLDQGEQTCTSVSTGIPIS